MIFQALSCRYSFLWRKSMQAIYYATDTEKHLIFEQDPLPILFAEDGNRPDFIFRYEQHIFKPLTNQLWISFPQWQDTPQEMLELKTLQSQPVGDGLNHAMTVYLVDLEAHPVAPSCPHDMIRKPYLILR